MNVIYTCFVFQFIIESVINKVVQVIYIWNNWSCLKVSGKFISVLIVKVFCHVGKPLHFIYWNAFIALCHLIIETAVCPNHHLGLAYLFDCLYYVGPLILCSILGILNYCVLSRPIWMKSVMFACNCMLVVSLSGSVIWYNNIWKCLCICQDFLDS